MPYNYFQYHTSPSFLQEAERSILCKNNEGSIFWKKTESYDTGNVVRFSLYVLYIIRLYLWNIDHIQVGLFDKLYWFQR